MERHTTQRITGALIAVIVVFLTFGKASAAWEDVTPGISTRTLYGVWGTAASDVYCVGANGTILHYNGAQWTQHTSPVSNRLLSVWGTSATNIYAVGDSGDAATLLRKTGSGTTWGLEPLTDYLNENTPYDDDLATIWGLSASNVYLGSGGGRLFRYDGTGWTFMDPQPATSGEPITGFWGVNSTNMYLVSYEQGAYAFKYSGGDEWVYTSTGTGRLNAIWGSSGSDIYVAGTGGHIARYNGAAWSGVSSATTKDLNDLYGNSPANIFAVGREGAIVHNKGAGFVNQSFSTASDLFGVWAAPDGSVAYAVGTDGLILKYTPDPVTTTTTTPGGTTTTTTPGGTTTTTTPGGTTTTSTVLPGEVGADFVASPLTGRVPLQVQFQNLSGGDISSYQWSFGDGSSSTERNPSHVYQKRGTYSVILTVIGGGGKTATKLRENYITAQSRCPVARSVNSTDALGALRALRDSRSETVMGSVLIALFYRNADEAAAILDASPELSMQLAGLIENNLAVFEALLQGDAASVPSGSVDELLGFLYTLQVKAGSGLAGDIDFVIRGIERGVLLPAMGITVK